MRLSRYRVFWRLVGIWQLQRRRGEGRPTRRPMVARRAEYGRRPPDGREQDPVRSQIGPPDFAESNAACPLLTPLCRSPAPLQHPSCASRRPRTRGARCIYAHITAATAVSRPVLASTAAVERAPQGGIEPTALAPRSLTDHLAARNASAGLNGAGDALCGRRPVEDDGAPHLSRGRRRLQRSPRGRADDPRPRFTRPKRHPLRSALVALPHVPHPPPRPRVPAVSLAAVNVSSTDMKCALPAYTVPLLSIPARIRTCHQASSRAPLQDA